MWTCKWCDFQLADTEHLNLDPETPCPRCEAPVSSFEPVEHANSDELSESAKRET